MAEQFLTLMADLDDEAQKTMGDWYGRLIRVGFTGMQTPGLPYHISMGSFALDREKEVVAEMEKLGEEFGPIPVHLSHMGMFAGGRILFAAPDMNPSGLLCLREAIKTEKDERFPWTPHATVLFDEPENIQKALPLFVEDFHPILARVEKLHLCAFWPTREIATVYLTGKKNGEGSSL